jgi:MFS family permease
VADAADPPVPGAARSAFPWIVFALAFALLLSDFMCRQVLAAVFPFLKADWALSDTELGTLSSVVALTVAVLTVPLSMLADRYGRRRAILLMAGLWSLATLGSALAAGYGQLLAARMLVGVGEAAYGSVGLAVVLAVFPSHRRAALSGAFTAGGAFGAVLGILLGGALAQRFGWRPAVPVAVLSKTEPFGGLPATMPAGLTGEDIEQLWPQVQAGVVQIAPQTPQILATGSDHYIQVHQPDLVVAATRLVIIRAAAPR